MLLKADFSSTYTVVNQYKNLLTSKQRSEIGPDYNITEYV